MARFGVVAQGACACSHPYVWLQDGPLAAMLVKQWKPGDPDLFICDGQARRCTKCGAMVEAPPEEVPSEDV